MRISSAVQELVLKDLLWNILATGTLFCWLILWNQWLIIVVYMLLFSSLLWNVVVWNVIKCLILHVAQRWEWLHII